MLRYMVLSDSHRAGGWLARAAEIYAQGGFDGCIHLGDVHADAQRFAERTGAALGGARILLAHGDRYGVKSSLTRLSYRAEELACQAAFFGHTHRAFCGYVGGALLLNPGALREGNWAEVTVQEGKIVPRLLSL